MEQKKRIGNFRILAMVLKDVFRIMPISMSLILILQLISAILDIISVVVVAEFIDSISYISDDIGGSQICFIWLCKLMMCKIISVISQKIIYKIKNIDITYKVDFFHDKIADFNERLSLEAVEIPEVGDMFWKAKDALYQDRMMQVIELGFSVFPNILRIIGTTYVLVAYNQFIVVLAIVSVIPAILARVISIRESRKLYDKQIKKVRKQNYLWNILTNSKTIREMQVLGFGGYIENKDILLRKELFHEQRKQNIKNNINFFICDIIKVIIYGGVIAFCILLFLQDDITIGAFSACLTAFISMQSAMEHIINSIIGFNENCRYVYDYYKFYNLKTEHSKDKKELQEEISELQLKNVSFAYPGRDTDALKDITLSIKKGEHIVLVGENGSGKSTLVKILMGLYEPKNGEIFVNQINSNKLTQSSIYQKFSVVTQQFIRYALSIRENIAIGNIKKLYDDKEIENILKEIELQDKDIDLELGKEFGGTDLSGGEWQKLAIGRALFSGRENFILDEPTSALDPIIEYNLLTQFIKLVRGKTAIFVSHRIGLCKYVDRIIVMKDGRIVETGDHETLLKQRAEYFKLWEQQASWYH